MPWYVAHTAPRAEWLAVSSLREAGYEPLCLHYPARVSHGRRVREVLKPHFPRYVFLRSAPGMGLYAARMARGVAQLVGTGQGPLEVPTLVLDELRGKCDPFGRMVPPTDGAADAPRLAPGQRARIVDGPLQGFIGTIALDGGREIRLWVELLGRRVETSLSRSAIAPVSP